jgi:tetratricopeptide (TPR) repeat protein
LHNIAEAYRHQGDNETALTYYEQCLSIRREIGDKIGEGMTLNNMAMINDTQEKLGNVLEYKEQYLAICRDLGDRVGEAVSCWNIGTTYCDMDDLAKAEEHIALAVEIAEQIGHSSLKKWRYVLERVRAKRRGA